MTTDNQFGGAPHHETGTPEHSGAATREDAVNLKERSPSPIRRWVYDPKGPYPVWVIRKFHNLGGGRFKLSSVNFGEAFPGDTICMDQSTGRYWVEKAVEK